MFQDCRWGEGDCDCILCRGNKRRAEEEQEMWQRLGEQDAELEKEKDRLILEQEPAIERLQRRCVADDPASAFSVLNYYKEIRHPFFEACLRGSQALPRGLRDPSKATVPELENALAIIEANKRPEAATDDVPPPPRKRQRTE